MTASLRITSVKIPLGFIGVGILALLAGMLCLATWPELLSTYHYNQRVIAVTHLVTLGWVCSVIMGAMYQLVPVALETKLYSARLATCHLFLHTAGFSGMVWMFWNWNIPGALIFGFALVAGIVLFAFNLAKTLSTISRWNVVAAGIAAGTGWLCLTVVAGLLIAASKQWLASPFNHISQMHAHAHLGGLGFFIMMILAVSYRLIPMFLLTEIRNQRRAWASIIILNVGTTGVFATVLVGSPIKLFFTLVVVVSLVLYGFELLAMLRSRKRVVLDWAIKYFLTGVGLLVPLSLLALVLSWKDLPLTRLAGQLENVYGLVALLGVITLAILGMLYKVVPFLVWYSTYSREIGRNKVPSLADLFSPRLQKIGYWLFLAGGTLTVLGTVMGHPHCIQRAAVVWTLSVMCFIVNFIKICCHLTRPQITPLVLNPVLKGANL